MPPALKGSKVTTVHSGPVGLADVLDDAMRDEPEPTAEAARLIEEARTNGPILPAGGAGDGPAPGLAAAAAAETGGAAAADNVADPDQGATTIATLLIGAACAVDAEEWAPDDDAEFEEFRAAFATYFEMRGTPNLPPELILLAAVGKYAGRRVGRPNTRAKLAGWLAGWPLVGRFFAPAAAEASPPRTSPGGVPLAAGPSLRE